MSEELKPCPFCGSKKIKRNHEDGRFWMTCQTCFADGPPTSKRSEEDAPDWNRRALAAEAEALMRWKQTAEYWYGQYRLVKHGESPAEYPAEGKLDDWHNSYHNL